MPTPERLRYQLSRHIDPAVSYKTSVSDLAKILSNCAAPLSCQGKDDEARDLLAPEYGWLTESFDTLDLQEAKALLGELAS
jgi:hypothetical protein